jgi:hypothetical protein
MLFSDACHVAASVGRDGQAKDFLLMDVQKAGTCLTVIITWMRGFQFIFREMTGF